MLKKSPASLPIARILQIRPRRLGAPRLGRQVRLPRAILASLPAAQGTGGGDLLRRGRGAGRVGALAEGAEELDDGLGGEVLVVVVVDLNHGGVDAGAETLDFDEGEEAVGGGLAFLDVEVFLDGLDDDVTSAAAELARSLETHKKDLISSHTIFHYYFRRGGKLLSA